MIGINSISQHRRWVWTFIGYRRSLSSFVKDLVA
jgi:hypothetical protein